MNGVFVIICTMSCTFLTEGNFHVDQGLMRTKQSTYTVLLSDNWKSFLQTSFWLCKFQTLSLLLYPPRSGARHWGTLCYQFMVSGPEPSCFTTIVGELAE